MDPQVPYNNLPEVPTSKPDGNPGNKKEKLYKTLLMVLGGVAAILLILVMVFGAKAFINDNKIAATLKQGQNEGATAQKKLDEEQFAKKLNADFRTYTAPEAAGSFTIDIPKSWSLTTTPEDSGNTISGIAMPDEVNTKLTQYALRFALAEKSIDSLKKPLDTLAQEKVVAKRKITAEETTVSGIKGMRYTGQIGTKIPNGTIVMVPLRDKTFTIQTDDNATYIDVFNAIVKNVHLNP